MMKGTKKKIRVKFDDIQQVQKKIRTYTSRKYEFCDNRAPVQQSCYYITVKKLYYT